MNPANGVCFVASKHVLSLYITLNSSRNLKQENLEDVFLPTINNYVACRLPVPSQLHTILQNVSNYFTAMSSIVI